MALDGEGPVRRGGEFNDTWFEEADVGGMNERAGGCGELRGDDVGGVAVSDLANIAACGAAIWVPSDVSGLAVDGDELCSFSSMTSGRLGDGLGVARADPSDADGSDWLGAVSGVSIRGLR